ncbi:MAG: hypothetical protein P8Z00_07935, partial [Anaerolineales bacterium]
MRKFIIAATLITILLATLLVSAGVALADSGPFRPGDLLFPFQRFAEEQRPLLISGQSGKADYYLRLVRRRIEDLHLVTGTPAEQSTLEELNQSLDRAAVAISAAPDADQPAMRKQLANLLVGLRVVLANLQVVPAQSPHLYNNVLAKVTTLESLIAGGQPLVNIQQNPSPEGTVSVPTAVGGSQSSNFSDAVNAHSVQFPPGSAGAEHAFFPLVGMHAELACESCHANGRFAGTPNTCVACHTQDKPAVHFVGGCVACHTAFSWQDIHFDHKVAGATDCVACHTKDKPANHFNGQCSACHNTSNWKNANFNHQVAGATNCVACHTKDKPANHFSGQCSACHNTSNWKNANFNHQVAGATNCVACHSKDKPANHFSGQCSNCHSTGSWKNAKFDHSGLTDCASCHSKDKPANHFSGQCSDCHNTGSWKNAKFDHSG